jgi:flagellar biosynthesis GTPase FlhF
MLTNKEVEKRPTTGELLCDGVVGDYVLEMYESQLNYVSDKEKMKKKDEEIKRIEKEKDEEIKKKDEIVKKKDEEIKRIQKEKDEEIKKKDEEIKRIIEEKDKEIKEIKEDKNERTKGLKVEKDEKIKRKDEENRKEKDEIVSQEQKPFSDVNIFASTSALTNNLNTNFKQAQIDEKGFLFFYFFFFLLFCYLEIKFIKLFFGVKIQQKTITFTKDLEYRTVFINKMINSGIVRMFIFFLYFLYLYILFC